MNPASSIPTKKTPPRRHRALRITRRRNTGISRRPDPARWSESEMLDALEVQAQASTKARRVFAKRHLIYVPRGGVIVSRRVLGRLFHRSPSGVQKLLRALESRGVGELIIGACGKLCRGKRHDHVSVFVFFRYTETPCQNVITRAVERAQETPSARYETNTLVRGKTFSTSTTRLLTLIRGFGGELGLHDDHAVRRLADRVPDAQAVEVGLRRITRSSFLRGKKPGRHGTRFTLTATWALDHFETIASGRYDDRGRFGTLPPTTARPLTFPDGTPVTVGTLGEYVARRGLYTVHSTETKRNRPSYRAEMVG